MDAEARIPLWIKSGRILLAKTVQMDICRAVLKCPQTTSFAFQILRNVQSPISSSCLQTSCPFTQATLKSHLRWTKLQFIWCTVKNSIVYPLRQFWSTNYPASRKLQAQMYSTNWKLAKFTSVPKNRSLSCRLIQTTARITCSRQPSLLFSMKIKS